MKHRSLLMAVGMLLGLCLLARGQEDAAKPKVTYGFLPGESMPFHVVDFVAGARQSGAGCPSVMISNGRTRGLEIWSRSADDAAFRLAGALEETLGGDKKARAFLLLFDNTAKETLRAQADKHGLKKFLVAVPRTMTKRTFQAADQAKGSSLMLFFMDRKEIKQTRSIKPGELDGEQTPAIVKEFEAFLAEPQ